MTMKAQGQNEAIQENKYVQNTIRIDTLVKDCRYIKLAGEKECLN